MHVICAWCKAHLSGDPEDPEITHGICTTCAEDQLSLLDESVPDVYSLEVAP